jgi:hypothetical protein
MGYFTILDINQMLLICQKKEYKHLTLTINTNQHRYIYYKPHFPQIVDYVVIWGNPRQMKINRHTEHGDLR